MKPKMRENVNACLLEKHESREVRSGALPHEHGGARIPAELVDVIEAPHAGRVTVLESRSRARLRLLASA